jgi:GGDEF domain-containing protein
MSQAMVGDKGVNKNAAQKNHSGIIFLLIFIFLAAADAALYQTKAAGRNRVVSHDKKKE